MDNYDIQLDSIIVGEALDKHFRTRNKKYIYKSEISRDDAETYLKDGWERVGPKNRKRVAIRKQKPTGNGFSDEVWCVFYRMGFSEMNKQNEFAIPRYGLEIGK